MYEETLKKIQECQEEIRALAEASQEYILAHDRYLEKYVKDSSLLKEKIKDKIVRVINEY
jgi:hypothetical protein